jgi:hypothetical protein
VGCCVDVLLACISLKVPQFPRWHHQKYPALLLALQREEGWKRALNALSQQACQHCSPKKKNAALVAGISFQG